MIAVGGATLGGSGKTPLAIACARELAQMGLRVGFVGHAYRANPRRARVVTARDPLDEVGDEALVATRELGRFGVDVTVAPTRGEAVAVAARGVDVIVLDGALQTHPVRASLSLLAVDRVEPWGRAAAVPPLGDLRAPIDALLSAADVVVEIGDGAPHAQVVSRGIWAGQELRAWGGVAGARLGLLCAVARPERVLRFLAARGVVPSVVIRARDHGPLPTRALRKAQGDVDLWIATAKCALHVPRSSTVATIDHALVLSNRLRAILANPIGLGAP